MVHSKSSLNPSASVFVPFQRSAPSKNGRLQPSKDSLAAKRDSVSFITTPGQQQVVLPSNNPWSASPAEQKMHPPPQESFPNRQTSPPRSPRFTTTPPTTSHAPRHNPPTPVAFQSPRPCFIVLRGLPATGKKTYARRLNFVLQNGSEERQIPATVIDNDKECCEALQRKDWLIVLSRINPRVAEYDWLVKQAMSLNYTVKIVEFQPTVAQIDSVLYERGPLSKYFDILTTFQKDKRAVVKPPFSRTWSMALERREEKQIQDDFDSDSFDTSSVSSYNSASDDSVASGSPPYNYSIESHPMPTTNFHHFYPPVHQEPVRFERSYLKPL